jgi:hypothetical protein
MTAAVLASHLGLALFVTWSWWTPLGGRISTVNAPDSVLFAWLLRSTPHALGRGELPLYSGLLNAPTGVNLMWNNGMVLPGVLFAPVTAVFGGLGAVTVITTVGLAGSAAAAFGCLRALDVRLPPAALGGALFGFSPAMLAQAVGGHPNLVFNVLVPVMLLLALRVLTGEGLRPAVLLGLTAGAQILIGEEVLFDTGVVVALLLLVLVIGRPREALARARAVAGRSALALGVFVLVAGGPLAFQLFGPLPQTGSPFTTSYFSTDLANHVVPTQLQAFASAASVAGSTRFPGGLEERTAYLGWPLLVLAVAAAVLMRRDVRVRTSLLLALLVAVLALGDELTVDGRGSGVPLPWALVTQLPGFEHVLANRFAIFTAGLLGAGIAFALDAVADRPPAARLAAGSAALLALVPLVPAPFPADDAPVTPAYFARGAACSGGTLLVLPYPGPRTTAPMLWQQAAGLSFAMPGGYFIGPAADGHAYVGGRPSVTGRLFDAVRADGVVRPVTPAVREAFAADMARWRPCAVVLGPSRNLDPLRDQATALLGSEPDVVDSVYLWRP